jgi:hypothetical protein
MNRCMQRIYSRQWYTRSCNSRLVSTELKLYRALKHIAALNCEIRICNLGVFLTELQLQIGFTALVTLESYGMLSLELELWIVLNRFIASICMQQSGNT